MRIENLHFYHMIKFQDCSSIEMRDERRNDTHVRRAYKNLPRNRIIECDFEEVVMRPERWTSPANGSNCWKDEDYVTKLVYHVCFKTKSLHDIGEFNPACFLWNVIRVFTLPALLGVYRLSLLLILVVRGQQSWCWLVECGARDASLRSWVTVGL